MSYSVAVHRALVGAAVVFGLCSLKAQTRSPLSALHFDGVDNVVTTPYTPADDVSTIAHFTAETWVSFSANPPVYYTYLNLIGKQQSIEPGSWSFELVVRQDPSLNEGQPFFTWRICNDWSGDQEQCSSEGSDPDDDFESAPYVNVPTDLGWHHVAGTYNALTGKANLYLDGTLARSWKLPAGYMLNDPAYGIQIGSFSSPGNYFYTNPFDLDGVGIWSKELTADEISAQYQAGLVTASD
jgi:hypothetical protein